MKTLIISFTVCLSFFVASSKVSFSQVDKKILQRPISIRPGSIRIDSLLKQFSRQTAVEFSFNSNKISPSKTLMVGKEKKTVSQWLSLLNSSFGIQHKFVGNHIILIDNSTKKPVTQKAVTNKKQTTAKTQSKSSHVALAKDLPDTTKKDEAKAEQPQVVEITKADTLQSVQAPVSTTANVPKQDTARNQPPKPAAQPENKLPVAERQQQPVDDAGTESDESVQLVLGYGRHGSGDMNGIVFGSEYWKDLSRRFSLGVMLRASINSSRDEIIVNNATSGQVTDASVRFTTAGVQLGLTGAFHIVNTAKSRFGIHLGAFGRYQSASNGSDGYGIILPPISNYPGALIEYDNRTPQHTVSLGGLFQFQYQYFISSRIYTGLLVGFQTDTNGDVLPQAGLIFGRRIR